MAFGWPDYAAKDFGTGIRRFESCRPSQGSGLIQQTHPKPHRPRDRSAGILSGMGRSNRLASLESKIAHLLGEHRFKKEEIAKVDRLVEALPAMRERLWEIETLISACEAIIKSDHPNWTRQHLKPLHAP